MIFRGDLLLNWRTGAGLSQSASAREVKISQEYWHALEQGKRDPSLKLLQAISEFTGLKKSILLGETKGEQRV